jgi:hypothetical protein
MGMHDRLSSLENLVVVLVFAILLLVCEFDLEALYFCCNLL